MEKKEYYNQEEFWSIDFDSDPIEGQKMNDLIERIPSDVTSILDAGCGNGAFLNRVYDGVLGRKLDRLVGLDFSDVALKYLKTEKMLGDVSKMPFKDREFDLVVCTDVIEHLPVHEFAGAISEIARIANKYIIIGVPNDENLEARLCKCTNCHCWYNPEYHMNTFNRERLNKQFDGFEAQSIDEIGADFVEAQYSPWTLLFFHYRLKRRPPFYSICPQCNFQDKPAEGLKVRDVLNESDKVSLKTKMLRPIKRLILPWKEKKRELLVLYKRIG